MTKSEALTALRESRGVKVWVKTSQHDGVYIPISKALAKRAVDQTFSEGATEIDAFIHADSKVLVIG
jgi:hypothetical protein